MWTIDIQAAGFISERLNLLKTDLSIGNMIDLY